MGGPISKRNYLRSEIAFSSIPCEPVDHVTSSEHKEVVSLIPTFSPFSLPPARRASSVTKTHSVLFLTSAHCFPSEQGHLYRACSNPGSLGASAYFEVLSKVHMECLLPLRRVMDVAFEELFGFEVPLPS